MALCFGGREESLSTKTQAVPHALGARAWAVPHLLTITVNHLLSWEMFSARDS